MRHGPMVHRSANTSRLTQRLTHGATSPLTRLHSLRGLAPLQLAQSHRRHPEDAEGFELQRLNLMSMLPINLRHFLANHLGSMLRIEGDSVFALDPHSGDKAIRELARAIRRFSAERARELWRECAVKLGPLAAELGRTAPAQRHVILCLGCASIAIGASATGRHKEAGCFAIELNQGLEHNERGPLQALRALVPDGLRRAVESFRLRRSGAGMAHFDLDCYLTSDQMIFTWRPLTVARDERVSSDEPAASRLAAMPGRRIE